MGTVLIKPGRRRRRTPQEKIAIDQETFQPGSFVSLVTHRHNVYYNQSLKWHKQCEDGCLTAVSAGEDVVSTSELNNAMKQICELQRLMGKKTMENEILKEAVEYGKTKKRIAHGPYCPRATTETGH